MHRVQDVALLAVGIVQQRQARRTVGVVFDRRHFGRHALLLPAKIHHAILPLVAAAAMPRSDFTVRVAPAGTLPRFQQRLLRHFLGDLALVEHGQEAP